MIKLYSNRSAKRSMVLSFRISLGKFWRRLKSTQIFIRKKLSKISTFWRIKKTMKILGLFLFTFWKRNLLRILWGWFRRQNIGKSWPIKKERIQLLSSVLLISLRKERDNKSFRKLRLFRQRRMSWLMRRRFLGRRKLKRVNMRKVSWMPRGWLMRLCRRILWIWLKRFLLSLMNWKAEELKED